MRSKLLRKKTRHKRVRNKIIGTSNVPRLTVFRSNKHIYAQIIDDSQGKTILASSDKKISNKKTKVNENNKIKIAHDVGKSIAKGALSKKIKKVVFDRGGFKYHGRVESLAQGAREEGLNF